MKKFDAPKKMRSFQDIIKKAQEFPDYWAESLMFDVSEFLWIWMDKRHYMNRRFVAELAKISESTLVRILKCDHRVSVNSIMKVLFLVSNKSKVLTVTKRGS